MTREYRDKRVTVADIADLTGVSRRTVTSWQERRPKLYEVLVKAVKTNRYLKEL